jgi:cystathionine beta-lyase
MPRRHELTVLSPAVTAPAFDDLDLAALHRRRGAKWNKYGPAVLASWVADMDFPPPSEVTAALEHSIATGDLGYASDLDTADFLGAFAEWTHRRHGWRPELTWALSVVDVVQGVTYAIDRLSRPGDGVLVQTPAYPPFFDLVDRSGRRVVEHPLKPSGELDIDTLRATARAGHARVLLVCNPHNPSGRVFTTTELQALTELALAEDLWIVADEIWADIVLSPHRHRSLLGLGEDVAARVVLVTSASKTFGLPGLSAAVLVAGSAELWDRLGAVPPHLIGHPSTLGKRAMAAAWRHGDAWVDALVEYIGANQRHAAARLTRELPGVQVRPAEATYLLWADCRALGLPAEPATIALKSGRVALGLGPEYGAAGAGWVRFNLATSRAIVDQIIDRFVAAVQEAAR